MNQSGNEKRTILWTDPFLTPFSPFSAMGVDYDNVAGSLTVKTNFIFGFRKPDVYTATGIPPHTAHIFAPSAPGISVDIFAMQPVKNFNATSAGGYAWTFEEPAFRHGDFLSAGASQVY